MPEPKRPRPPLRPFDAADYLDSTEAVMAYLGDAVATGERAEFIEALRTALRAMQGETRRPQFQLEQLLEVDAN